VVDILSAVNVTQRRAVIGRPAETSTDSASLRASVLDVAVGGGRSRTPGPTRACWRSLGAADDADEPPNKQQETKETMIENG